MKLKDIAYARSGDKGPHANIGVLAIHEKDYEKLLSYLTEERVKKYFSALNPTKVIRYPMPNLQAINLILENALDEGASLNLRIDAQGKALGQILLEMEMDE